MRILPNFVYNFLFVANFTSLDGIYKVLSISSYDALVTDGIDLFKVLYEANGLLEADFESDIDAIRDARIFKLEDVNDPSNLIFMPEFLFVNVPDNSVQKYMRLGIVCDIGIHDNENQVTTLKSEIEQTITAMIGANDNAVVYKISDAWMTETDYAAIVATREANISTVSNSYTDKVALQLEVDRLRTKITYYENLIKSI